MRDMVFYSGNVRAMRYGPGGESVFLTLERDTGEMDIMEADADSFRNLMRLMFPEISREGLDIDSCIGQRVRYAFNDEGELIALMHDERGVS